MNERIKELFHESIEDCDGTMKNRVYSLKQSEIEKFAELIVNECIECADIVGKANLASAYPNSTAHHVKQKIKEHFGVEE